MSSLAVKYRPKTFDDVTEQSVVTEILDSICENNCAEMSCRNFLLIGPAGCGKAQPLYSKVLTPTGYIEMKDILVGDDIITGSGDVANVSGIYPQGKRDIYRIHLSNGDFIDVSDEHINILYALNEEGCEYRFNRLTSDLIYDDDIENYFIPTHPINLKLKTIPEIIDPFFLGVLSASSKSVLVQRDGGDGEISVFVKNTRILNNLLRHNSKDNKIMQSSIEENQFIMQKASQSWIDSFFETFSFCEVFTNIYDDKGHEIDEHKKIDSEPERSIFDYMSYTDIDTRHMFLEGFFSCCAAVRSFDGSILFKIDRDDFKKDDFKFLVESLGYVLVTNDDNNFRMYVTSKYVHSTSLYDYFNDFYSNYLAPINMRYVEEVCYLGKMECQCLMIDHNDHSYISDNLIPTHNTTCARIMANRLNDNVGQPIEIDAASYGNVDSIRELVKQAQQYPVGQNYKIFVVDECHSISNAGWQALLATLESSPAKTIWIFCTTNPEKIPETILSRVQTFQLSKISLKGIHDRLIHVIEEENKEGRNITYTEDAVNYIAKLANGGMRDSLTLLDKALAHNEEITPENLAESLNLPDYDDYFDLLSAYAKKNNEEITRMIDKVYNSGVNFVKWFESFHSFVINIMKFIYLQDINMTMIPSTYQDKISKYSTKHIVVCLKLADKLLSLNHELKNTQYLQEVALTYLCSVPKKS